MRVLVTGGAGYIGSHTVIQLQEAGYEVVIVDNFSNSKPEVLNRIAKLSGKAPVFYEIDLLDRAKLEEVFINEKVDAVIHFAGLKAVGESVQMPLTYYHNNLTGTFILCELMEKYQVYNMVFSSSATVYGLHNQSPLTEDLPLSTTNPYGATKLMIENILRDVHHANPKWNIAMLRYFNPIGAHISGEIGEDPNDVPNNLMPYITQVAVGKREQLSIFGKDYDTHDGTGVRDYIHVEDLAAGHIKAVEWVKKDQGIDVFNLGTGKGYSVLDVVNTFKDVNDVDIPYVIADRRAGDIGACFADASKAYNELGWKAEKQLQDMCADSWRWQSKNPAGYITA